MNKVVPIETAIRASIKSRTIAKTQKEHEGYIAKDGLLYCSECHTPKEIVLTIPNRVPYPGKAQKMPVMCKCKEEEYRRNRELRRKQEEMQRVRDLKVNSLMDEKFRDSTFPTFVENRHNARPLKLCKRYAEHFDEMIEKNQGLLFYGDVGTGKTYMAACIANHLMDRLNTCMMTSFVKILQNVQGFKGEEEEQRFIAKINRAKLLIIDDLGAERSTDYALEKVYNVVDSRYRSRKPMILTTNLTISEMQATGDIRYSRIYDRIFEVCYPIEFKGPSWRKEEAARRFDDMTRFLEGDE